METFKLKDAAGEEQVYSAENGVQIPDQNGVMQSYINKNTLDNYKYSLLAFGDAEKEGAVICSPGFDRVQVWGRYSTEMHWTDSPYKTVLNQIGADTPDTLDTAVALGWDRIQSVLKGIKTNGADGKVLFMGKACDPPELLDSDARSFAGLLTALRRSVAKMPSDFSDAEYLDADKCVRFYVSGSESYAWQAGCRAQFPFVWQNAVENGETTEYKLYLGNRQEMPTYATGRAVYEVPATISSSDFPMTIGSFNAGAADGMTGQLVAICAGGQYWMFASGTAQSVPRSVLLEMLKKLSILDGMSDEQLIAAANLPETLAVPAGMSIAIADSSWTVISADTEDENELAVLNQMETLIGSVTITSLPGDMDTYTKGWFFGKATKLYKAGKYSFTLELNLIYPQTAEEDTTA